MNKKTECDTETIAAIDRWLRNCVLGLSLCPYARVPFEAGQVRVVTCLASDFSTCLEQEIDTLQTDTVSPETTLIVFTDGYEDFLDFNDLAGEVEDLLYNTGLADVIQLASFHPAYLFGGEAPGDASHYSNRAPFPVMQLLRTASVSRAVESGDTLAIPKRNMDTLRALDEPRLRSLFPWVR